MMHSNNDNTFVRKSSPNFSDDGNSESAMATLPICNKKQTSNNNLEMCSSKTSAAYQTIINQSIDTEAILTGRNTFAFWTIVSIIFILTVGNLILTMTILGVLHLGKGMEHLELVPEADSIKFFGITDLDRIYKKDGVIEGFADVPMSITGKIINFCFSCILLYSIFVFKWCV